MAVHIETSGGRVRVTADDGSTVSGIRVGDKYVVGTSPAFWDRPAGHLTMWALLLLFCLTCWGALIFCGGRTP